MNIERFIRKAAPKVSRDLINILIMEATNPLYVKDAGAWEAHYRRHAYRVYKSVLDDIKCDTVTAHGMRTVREALWRLKVWREVARQHGLLKRPCHRINLGERRCSLDDDGNIETSEPRWRWFRACNADIRKEADIRRRHQGWFASRAREKRPYWKRFAGAPLELFEVI